MMSDCPINLGGARLWARPSGALWWPEMSALIVADLHLGRSERVARLGGGFLPPYETEDTLTRLEDEVAGLAPRMLISLGDSFDDLRAANTLGDEVCGRLERLAAGRRLIWVAGNHDPGPVSVAGTYLSDVTLGSIVLRHISNAGSSEPEISAHYHPKATLHIRGKRITRRVFLVAGARVVMPAFGTYTGGLDVFAAPLAQFCKPDSHVLLIGKDVSRMPLSALGGAATNQRSSRSLK